MASQSSANELETSQQQSSSSSSISMMPCIVCGPSGVGKGTLLNKMKTQYAKTFGVAVSHTTRQPRQGEIDGVHYHFVSRKAFEQGIQKGEFAEFADVHGNYYGTSLKAIEAVQAKKLICILEIDVQGAKIIRDAAKLKAHYLFITAQGGLETLKARLTQRNTESAEQIAKRLATAEKEFAFLDKNASFFECVISNDDLEKSAQILSQQFRSWYPHLQSR